MMANLQHSIESLEKQDLPNSEIFDIMSSTVNSQLKESLWFHITMWNNSPNNSEQALRQGDISKTAETPGRKAYAFSSGKIQRNQTIPGPGSLGFCLQKKAIFFKSTFSLTLSPLSGRPSRFRFSANMDEDFEAEKRGFNGDFPELPKKTQSQINDFNENLNIKRKAFLLRNEKYFKTIKVVSWFIQKNTPQCSNFNNNIVSVGQSKNYFKKKPWLWNYNHLTFSNAFRFVSSFYTAPAICSFNSILLVKTRKRAEKMIGKNIPRMKKGQGLELSLQCFM